MKRLLVGAALTAGVSAATVIRNNRLGTTRRYDEQPVSTQDELEEHAEEMQEHPPRQLFRNLKWPTLLGNIGVGAAEVLTGGGSSLAVTVDGVHNLGDAAGYASQFYAEEEKQAEKVHRLRKIGHWIIASSSAIVGSKAAFDLATQNEHVVHPGALAAAGASLALNGYIGRDIIPKVRKYGWRRLSGAQRDIAKHFALVDAPSSVLAVGGALAAGASAHQASATAAVVSGAVGAWVFRPTERNLAEPHTCAAHGRHNHNHNHLAQDSHDIVQVNPKRRRRAVLLGAVAAAVAAGVSLVQIPSANAPTLRAADVSEESHSAKQMITVEDAPVVLPAKSNETIYKTYEVTSGDSLWKIVEDKFCVDDDCDNQSIADTVDTLSQLNRLPNPDLIFPGQELVLPRA